MCKVIGAAARRWKLHTDGAARGRAQGPAAAGVALYRPEGDLAYAEGKRLGVKTNNEAEYHALLLGLQALAGHAIGSALDAADIVLDSRLVVEQVIGRFQVHEPRLAALCDQARDMLAGLRLAGLRLDLRWAPRAQNAAADKLANLALDHGDLAYYQGGPVQPPIPPAYPAGKEEA